MMLKIRTQQHVEESLQQKKFEKTGIFDLDTIRYIKPGEDGTLLSLSDLVFLLVHLNIAAEISSTTEQSLEEDTPAGSMYTSKKEYFLPAILKSADISSLVIPSGPSEEILPEPLCIRFQTGYLPMGFSCALIAKLLSEEKIKLPPDEVVLYKNKMKFRYDGQFNIIMISLPTRCEFHVARHSGHKLFHDQEVCPDIMKIICEAADGIIKSMQRSLLSENNYDFAFKCKKHRNTKFGHEPLAKCVYTDETRTQLKQIECLECVTTITDLNSEIKIWFGQVSTY